MIIKGFYGAFKEFSMRLEKGQKEKFSNVVLKWKQIWSISYHYCKLSRYSVHNMKMSGVHT